ncbi:MAG: hypothetical protein RQ735_09625 [Flavobacteriaceae bacterium]|nr:hypothetical protein [Flavobacteriaceae bacterium]
MNSLKKILVKRIVRKRIAAYECANLQEGKLESMLILFDAEAAFSESFFTELGSLANIPPGQTKWLGFSAKPRKHKVWKHPVFHNNNIGWDGTLKGDVVDVVLNRPYDLVVNYFDKPSWQLKAAASQVQTGLRLGFEEVNADINDIVFKADLKAGEVFKTEFCKYLKALRKL